MRVTIRTKSEYEAAIKRRDLLQTAWEKIIGGAQSYSIGGQQLTRASLARIESELDAFNSAIENYEAYGNGKRHPARRIIPLG